MVDCRKCQHVGPVPNSIHCSCKHPRALEVISKGSDLFEFLRVVINQNRIPAYPGLITLDPEIIETYEPIQNGWLTWPINFDPRWIKNCNGFEEVWK